MHDITQTQSLFEIKNASLSEEWNLTFILSYVPLLWFLNHGKTRSFQNKILLSNVKINSYFTLFCFILLAVWYYNLVSFLFLGYIVAVVFASIFLLTQAKIFTLHTPYLFTLDEILFHIKCGFEYFKNYFWSNSFQNYSNIQEKIKEKELQTNAQNQALLSEKKSPKLPFFLIYVPFVNIISLIDWNTKHQFHIINGFMITMVSILLQFTHFWAWQILLLFPIFYGLWEKNNLAYRFPILFQVFMIFVTLMKKIFFIGKTTKKLHEEVKQTTYEIK
jgi:hypothetical protein